jgi:hypothetical protein
MAHWSPRGRRIAIFCCDNGMIAHIINPGTRRLRERPNRSPRLELHCGGAWSINGRLACEGFGITNPRLNGVYSVRSRDGRGLRRVTYNPGGDDIPGDYSPNGKRLVFLRMNEQGVVGLFVARAGGSRTPHDAAGLRDRRRLGRKLVATRQQDPLRHGSRAEHASLALDRARRRQPLAPGSRHAGVWRPDRNADGDALLSAGMVTERPANRLRPHQPQRHVRDLHRRRGRTWSCEGDEIRTSLPARLGASSVIARR